ncbi:MAG: SPOR domain-containing protein [Gammaproteobacteria bacterium]|nr:SPOR domain-containing protein [Gammaproteobacteria bacterium]
MDKDQIKKRIVGAIVLVALGVIFIPMLLSGDNDNTRLWGTNIPEKPKPLQTLAERPMPSMPTPPPTPEATRNLVDSASSVPPAGTAAAPISENPAITASPAAPIIATTTPSPSVTPTPAYERAWAVQAGSFNRQANALSLRDKLRKKKYTAFVESIRAGTSTTYRVRVGPYLRRSEAETEAAAIEKLIKIRTVVLPHP